MLIASGTQLYFHAMRLMSTESDKQNLYISRHAVNSSLTVVVGHLMQQTWDAITKFYLLGHLRVVVDPYMSFKPSLI